MRQELAETLLSVSSATYAKETKTSACTWSLGICKMGGERQLMSVLVPLCQTPVSVEQVESCSWTSRVTQTLYWPSKMVRGTLGSSIVSVRVVSLCLKLMNKCVLCFRDHMQEVSGG